MDSSRGNDFNFVTLPGSSSATKDDHNCINENNTANQHRIEKIRLGTFESCKQEHLENGIIERDQKLNENGVNDGSNDHKDSTSQANNIRRWTWWPWNDPVDANKATSLQERNGSNSPDKSSENMINVNAPASKKASLLEYFYDNNWSSALNRTSSSAVDNKRSREVNEDPSKEQALILNAWFAWLWGNPVNENDDTIGDDKEKEMFKTAKRRIEGEKMSNYALRNTLYNHKREYYELALYGTETEFNPVEHSCNSKPLTPNEVQESYLLQNPGSSHDLKIRKIQEGGLSNSTSNITTSQKKDESLIRNCAYLIPSFGETFREITVKTRLRLWAQRLTCNFNNSEKHIYHSGPKDVSQRREVIKNVMVVGLHEFLPTKMVKNLIGRSTGNASLFVEEASKAVRTWLESNDNGNEDCTNYHIDTIALEGTGKIDERVKQLRTLLNNWTDSIKNSDFVFFVAHSLASVVAIHLLAQYLVDNSHLLYKKRIALLCMAGTFVGPFESLNSKLVVRAYSTLENDILSELFALQKPYSEQSLLLSKSMETLIDHNVKITLFGALDDQLVPIFSSLAVNFNHPNIFKSLLVNGNSDIPQFVITLLKIAIIMLNMGHSDHNLLRDLSEKCMGCVPDGGHSSLYGEQEVYLAAIKHALESTDLVRPRPLIVLPLSKYTNPKHLSFPYHLPWNVRGLLQDFIHIKNQPCLRLISQLLHDFHLWLPTLKKWKDLKHYFDAFEDIDLDDVFI